MEVGGTVILGISLSTFQLFLAKQKRGGGAAKIKISFLLLLLFPHVPSFPSLFSAGNGIRRTRTKKGPMGRKFPLLCLSLFLFFFLSGISHGFMWGNFEACTAHVLQTQIASVHELGEDMMFKNVVS